MQTFLDWQITDSSSSVKAGSNQQFILTVRSRAMEIADGYAGFKWQWNIVFLASEKYGGNVLMIQSGANTQERARADAELYFREWIAAGLHFHEAKNTRHKWASAPDWHPEGPSVPDVCVFCRTKRFDSKFPTGDPRGKGELVFETRNKMYALDQGCSFIRLAEDFSAEPKGRRRSDGEFSGEAFRAIISEALDEFSRVTIDLALPGDACIEDPFLAEAFGGLLGQGYSRGRLENSFQLIGHRSNILRANQYISGRRDWIF